MTDVTIRANLSEISRAMEDRDLDLGDSKFKLNDQGQLSKTSAWGRFVAVIKGKSKERNLAVLEKLKGLMMDRYGEDITQTALNRFSTQNVIKGKDGLKGTQMLRMINFAENSVVNLNREVKMALLDCQYTGIEGNDKAGFARKTLRGLKLTRQECSEMPQGTELMRREINELLPKMSDEQIVQIHKGIHSQELFQAFENSLQGNELKRSDKRLLKDIEIFQNVVLGEMSSRGIKLYDKSISMEDAMLHPQARHDFKNFCESELTEENFNFYHDVQNYRQLSGQAQVDEAKRMMDKYIISNVEENQGYISFMDIT